MTGDAAASRLSGSEIAEEIRKFLLEDPEFGFSAQDLSANQSLLTAGLIDSLAVLDVITFLESRFNVQFEAEDLTGENFDRISSMAALVRSRMSSADRNS